MAFTVIISLILSVLGIYVVKVILFPQKRQALPPGPKPKFLIGNLLDVPKPGETEWMHWLKHRDLYGPISSVTIMGQTLIIINETQLAYELMEKRSLKHSSRPSQVFGGEMVGWENSLAFNKYSDRFRAHRKHMAQVLGSKVAVSRFNLLQEVEVGRFLLRTLETPDKLLGHIRREAGAVILKIAYGYTIEPHKSDPLVELAGKSLEEFAKAAVPGVWLVDIMPFLRYLPDWFPGTGFKRTAREWRATLTDLTERPYAFVKHQMAQGKHEPSFLSQLLESGDLNEEETFVAKWSALSLYSGGADTTVSSMSCFFLAMTVFPEVQRKAQEEIDQKIGTDRLPGFQDRQNLPYIDAIVKEVLRWHPVGPMAIPHMTTEDDILGEYLIPKGALLLPNIWFFTHDPDVYHEPMEFKPERFLPIDGSLPEPDPHKLSFGFGRRICPGQFLADSSLFLNIAQTLAVFQISKAIEKGQVIDPSVSFLPGVISHPTPFKTSITPRSQHHEALIRSVEQIHPWQESDAELLEMVTN
ncbi:putative cytochrome P450 oxidoreductase OrdA-like protein [Stipitochalara longipes BDJ]|nr:putative cytochrome P450 oxidoreductase OrdA-like protein [Stipitochalara longipes BDJ]